MGQKVGNIRMSSISREVQWPCILSLYIKNSVCGGEGECREKWEKGRTWITRKGIQPSTPPFRMFVQQLCKNKMVAPSNTPAKCVFIWCRFLEMNHTLKSCLFPFVVQRVRSKEEERKANHVWFGFLEPPKCDWKAFFQRNPPPEVSTSVSKRVSCHSWHTIVATHKSRGVRNAKITHL